ncbi:MAG: hypothetical protein SGPRY_012605 [Prymnesium sp.]
MLACELSRRGDVDRNVLASFSQASQMSEQHVKASMEERSNPRSGHPTRITRTLHTDNAGEFISRDFRDMLDDELVDHTISPPHVHALNGVAERAIRSSMELERSYLTSSRVPVERGAHGCWTCLIEPPGRPRMASPLAAFAAQLLTHTSRARRGPGEGPPALYHAPQPLGQGRQLRGEPLGRRRTIQHHGPA